MENERISICNQNFEGISLPIENEEHFLFFCSLYGKLRGEWMSKMQLPSDFSEEPTSEKIKLVLNEHVNVKLTSQFIIDAFDLRSRKINQH